jgi:hypothetical protein
VQLHPDTSVPDTLAAWPLQFAALVQGIAVAQRAPVYDGKHTQEHPGYLPETLEAWPEQKFATVHCRLNSHVKTRPAMHITLFQF